MIEEVKQYRESNRLSQQKMADMLGVPRSRYQKWEDGKANPKHDDMITITNFLSKLESTQKKRIGPTGNVAMHSSGLDAGTHITVQDFPEYVEEYATIKGLGQNIGSFIVTGHSMYPTISKGTRVVLGPEITNLDLMIPNELYAVDIREHGAKIKRIRRGKDADHWLLISDNQDYGPLEVNYKKDVIAVYRVLMSFEQY